MSTAVQETARQMAAARAYEVCTRCVMDTSDPKIVFDEDGVCNHCKRVEYLLATRLPLYRTGEYRIDRIAAQIKAAGRHKRYDCVIGVSGGTDSTYAAYVAKQQGLRPLAVHFDNGWNSELAVKNIENVLKKLGMELFTYVVDWEEFRDLQLSFLKASVPDAEIPTDHGIWALLFQTAARFGVKYVVTGTNISTESILPRSWTYYVTDWTYIRGIHRQFGTRPLHTFPNATMWQFMYDLLIRRIRTVSILNCIPYSKREAVAVLERELGWRNYAGKHHESIYTRFFQEYILPVKFGIDKRRAHLSSLLHSGQMTRDEALAELQNPPGDPAQLREDLIYVTKKFDLDIAGFERLMALPRRCYRDYPNESRRYERIRRLMGVLQQSGVLRHQVGL